MKPETKELIPYVLIAVLFLTVLGLSWFTVWRFHAEDARLHAEALTRQLAVCKSSTDLRTLLNQWVPVLRTTPSIRPQVTILEQAITKYTSTNPNCKGLK